MIPLVARARRRSLDPFYSNVSLLLHCNGTNGSTTFTDNGPSALTCTPTATTISTASPKFGTGRAAFTASGTSKITFSSDTPFAFGTGDLTIEMWVNWGGAACDIFASRDLGSNNAITIIITAGGKISLGHGGSSILTSTTSLTNGTTQNLAVTRSGSTWRVFIDGVVDATTISDAVNITASTARLGSVPNDGFNTPMLYMDEIRITKGVARYTSTFTPQTAEFPNSA